MHYVKTRTKARMPKQHIAFFSYGKTCTRVKNAHKLVGGYACVFSPGRAGGEPYGEIGYDSREEFWQWMSEYAVDEHRTIAWTFGAPYQLGLVGFARQIDNGAYTVEHCCDSDPPFFVRGRYGESRLDIWDIQNWLGQNCLSNDANLYKYPALIGANVPAEESCIAASEFVAARITTLVKTILGLVSKHGLGPLRPTVASQAMTLYRMSTGQRVGDKHYSLLNEWQPCQNMKKRVLPLIHGLDRVLDFEREAFSGGVLRGWRYGEVIKGIYVLDVNSLYPYIMRRTPVPAKLSGSFGTLPSIAFHAAPRSIGYVARVKIDSPLVPYPRILEHETVYATGRYWTTLCGDELRNAANLGHIVEVREVHRYDCEYLFDKHAAVCMKERNKAHEKGEKVQEKIWKLLANTLWSKWAQRAERWQVCDVANAPQTWGRWAEYDCKTRCSREFKAFGGQVWERLGIHHSPDAFPAVSAFIASAARLHMYHLYEVCGPENLIYTCIDSLHVCEGGYRRLCAAGLCDNIRPGLLKLERAVKEAYYYAPGWYWHDGTMTAAGLSAERQNLSPDSWRVLQKGGAKMLMDGKLLDAAPAWSETVNAPAVDDPRKGNARAMRGLWGPRVIDTSD